MSTLKLYTEEQVKEMLNKINKINALLLRDDKELLLKYAIEHITHYMTPIELPRYKDIIFERNVSNPYLKESQSHCAYELGFERSAKWTKEQILNQNK